jgi:L-seryl-tRNA(Ser) seleniumtransferase
MHGSHRDLREAISDEATTAALRALPQVQRLLELPEAAWLLQREPRAAVVDALRAALDAVRADLRAGKSDLPSPQAIITLASGMLNAAAPPALRCVLNATGIVLHTNLGRAPLAQEALAAIADAAGYANLEFALDTGTRGPRAPGIEALLCALTGAQAAVVVNNCAAAMLLTLSALASGGEVLVSRGELIEIGGGFRIPDVIQQGGARLVEIGTTNKTRVSDYASAITPATRVILKVHPSNYRMVGFTAEADLPSLATLARERGLLLVHDLGSGAMQDLRSVGRPHEPSPAAAIAAGADVVAFSGDKLLGGPQAGLIIGTAAAIAPLRRHPLMRALRLDKLSLAALEATLRLHQDPGRAFARIPALRMLAQDDAALLSRAHRLARLTPPPAQTEIVASTAHAGGGTLPATDIPSRAVALSIPGLSADELSRRLRLHHPAIVGRIADGRVLLDVFTLDDTDLAVIADAIGHATP